MNEPDEKVLTTVRKIFMEYLNRKNYRKTKERFIILDEIYRVNGHFDIDSLYTQMSIRRVHVSKATIYNTVELLMDCNLVTRHQFGRNCAQYECSYEFKQHDHFIDLSTGAVFEYCDPRIMEIQKSVEEMFDVDVAYHSLIFYGTKKKHKRKRIGAGERIIIDN
ncbi:MAG: Fur family transcriptional regulator [Candidatus Limimorpha sp.]